MFSPFYLLLSKSRFDFFVCVQEIHALLWQQRRRLPAAEPPRLNALQRVGKEHRGVAEAHFTGQVFIRPSHGSSNYLINDI